jgi:hypothetical protein
MKKIALIASLIVASLSLIAGSLPTASTDEPHGIVSMALAKPGADQFKVNVTMINDANVLSKRSSYWISPGEHTFRLVPTFDGKILSTSRGRLHRKSLAKELVINVEPGKRYSLAAKLTTHKADEWQPVVVDVVEIKNYKDKSSK